MEVSVEAQGLSNGDNDQFSDGSGPNSAHPRPNFAWSYIAVKHPKIATSMLLLIPIICTSIIFGAGLFSLSPLELENFYVRTDIRSRDYHSLRAALSDYPFDLSVRQGNPQRSFIIRRNSIALVLRNTRPNSKKPYLPAVFDKTTTASNVFTPERLALMRQAEKKVLELQKYPRYCYKDASTDCNNRTRQCALPISLSQSPFTYGEWDIELQKLCGFKSEQIAPVRIPEYIIFLGSFFPESFKKSISALIQQLPKLKILEQARENQEKMSLALGTDFSQTNPTSQLMRSVIPMGYPVGNLSTEELIVEFGKWAMEKVVPAINSLSTSKFHLQAVSASLVRPLIESAVIRVALFALGSVFLVFIVAAIHTGSFFLALITMLQILLSFPLPFFVYRYIFQIKHFGVLNVTTLFLLLGIGADDVFVFTDTWNQAGEKLGPNCKLVDRMIFTYRRAVKAMT